MRGPGMVDLHNLGLFPAAWLLAPALRVPLTSFVIGLLPNGTDRVRLTIMTLIGRHILDAAMSVFVVVPPDKAIDPAAYG